VNGRALHVALLQLGGPRSGIYRYGSVIGSELRALKGVSVIEHEADLTAPGWRGLVRAFAVVRVLRGSDVVIMPYGRYRLWSSGTARLVQLLTVHLGLRGRTLTVLHDVYSAGRKRDPERLALAISTTLSGATIVHSERDLSLLRGLPTARGVRVIPHFVEPRTMAPREQARAALGVDAGCRVVGMIGWIHPRKNYEVAIHALSRLGEDTQLWLVGDAPSDGRGYLKRLSELARELGVENRVLITGYVTEAELDLRLAAIDVGLCPYLDASASGSLSTLLGARRPAVVSDIELTRELRNLAAQAICITDASESDALAAGIQDVLARAPGPEAFDAVLADRSPAATARRYLQTLSGVAHRSRGLDPDRSHRPGGGGTERRERGAVGELVADQDGGQRN
jgi:glycosyltransferase involved in cell wall biosynthesis